MKVGVPTAPVGDLSEGVCSQYILFEAPRVRFMLFHGLIISSHSQANSHLTQQAADCVSPVS